jgi:TRAP-type C4-dicarboxylate transport system permease small subunit
MIDSLINRMNVVLLFIGGLAILGMVLLNAADVISTLVLKQPVHSVYEGTQTLMVVAVFLGLAAVHQNRAYIAVDVIYVKMPKWARDAIDVLTLICMIGFFGIMAWRSWVAALRSTAIGEYSVGIVLFPIYPAKILLALGVTLAFLCCIADLLNSGKFRRGHDGSDTPLT